MLISQYLYVKNKQFLQFPLMIIHEGDSIDVSFYVRTTLNEQRLKYFIEAPHYF